MARRSPAKVTNDLAYIDSGEALRILGIRRASFYTYVSRGLVKTRAVPGRRTKEYRKADVERLKTLAARRSGTRAAQSLRYGEPIVQTWISEITPDGPSYRGYTATDLVRAGHTFEYASEILWHGPLHARDRSWPAATLPQGYMRTPVRSAVLPGPIAVLVDCVVSLQRSDDSQCHLGTDHRHECVRILQALAGGAGLIGPERSFVVARADESIAAFAARALMSTPTPEAVSLIDALLVLSADNELSAPTFCARICASTGGDLLACVASALMTHAGPMQVGGTFELEAVLDAACRPRKGGARRLVEIPCFGHPLYEKDPRGALLVDRVRMLENPYAPETTAILDFVDTAASRGLHPNIFAGCVIVSRCLGLPLGAGAYLQTLGRISGWMAHAMEQRLAGSMLRPRARYMGNKQPD